MSDRPVILVVDDDAPILLLMRNLLREYGFDTLTADSGQKALEVLKQNHRPDLVLLDRNMPGMNGDEVLRAMRGDGGLGDVPVVMLTGEPLGPDEIRALGATASVTKPFDVPALVELIRTHVR